MPETLTLLQKCMKALGWTDQEYEDLVQDDIDAAKADLGIAGITQNTVDTDPLIRKAILTYVMMTENISAPEYQNLRESYEMQKKNLMSATGYTSWGDGSDQEPDPEPDPEQDPAPEEGGDG